MEKMEEDYKLISILDIIYHLLFQAFKGVAILLEWLLMRINLFQQKFLRIRFSYLD